MSTHFDSSNIDSVIQYVRDLKETVGLEGVSDTTEALILLAEKCEILKEENSALKSLVIDSQSVIKQIRSNSEITNNDIIESRKRLGF